MTEVSMWRLSMYDDRKCHKQGLGESSQKISIIEKVKSRYFATLLPIHFTDYTNSDMALFFTLLLLVCSLCVDSFHLKLQRFSNAASIQNIRGELPRLQSYPHSASKIQTSTKLSSLIQHSANIKPSTTYWDLYGRVPYDDWLFTTSHLTNPDLLKRSFVEAVSQRKAF